MRALVSIKIVRLLLTVSVSLWMAGGGCLLGCGNYVSAAEASPTASHSAQTVVAGESCHSVRSHDCCAKQAAQNQTATKSNKPEMFLALAAIPRGMMKDCPLVVNATVTTSKNSGNFRDPEYARVASLPQIETRSEQSHARLIAPLLPNRGPTYLLGCVFLI